MFNSVGPPTRLPLTLCGLMMGLKRTCPICGSTTKSMPARCENRLCRKFGTRLTADFELGGTEAPKHRLQANQSSLLTWMIGIALFAALIAICTFLQFSIYFSLLLCSDGHVLRIRKIRFSKSKTESQNLERCKSMLATNLKLDPRKSQESKSHQAYNNVGDTKSAKPMRDIRVLKFFSNTSKKHNRKSPPET